MDVKVVVSMAAAIGLAELGDKTQLAVLGAAASTRKPLEVWLGAMLGFVVATALGVAIAAGVGHLVPMRWLRAAGGVLFVILGIWFLLSPSE